MTMASAFPLEAFHVPHTIMRISQGFTNKQVTLGGTPHVKTAWTQIYATTLEDTYMVRLYVDSTFTSTTNSSLLVDIGVGNTGLENVVVANLLCGYWRPAIYSAGAGAPVAAFYDIPLFIPIGTRIAFRAQGATASQVVAVTMDLFGRPTAIAEPFTGHAIDSIGPDTATSHGAALTCGASGSTGSWTQLVASSSHSYRGFMVGVDGGGSTTVASENMTFDIAAGASGSEQLLVVQDYIHVVTSTAETVDMRCPANHLVMLANPIPSGTRISMRGTQSAATAQTVGVALYGIR